MEVFILASALIMAAFVKETRGSSPKPPTLCLSEACFKRANFILHMMDETVNPCEDFYQFTCGNFLKNQELEKANSINVWIAEYISQTQIYAMLSAPPVPDEPEVFHTAKLLYKLCMDEGTMNKRGVAPMLELLKGAGGWPVLGNWNSENWNFFETELRLRDLGIGGGSLFTFKIGQFGLSRRVIELTDLGDWQELMAQGEGEPKVQRHYEYMVEAAVLLGADRQTAERDMMDVLQLEIDMAKLKEKDDDFDLVFPKELTEKYSWLPWGTFLEKTIGKSAEIRPAEIIAISNPIYIKTLGSVLARYPDRVIANYMMWSAVSTMADMLTSKFRELKPRRPRSEECHDVVFSRIPLVVSSMFAKNFNDTKQAVEIMTEKLRQEMLRIIIDTEWLDDKTRLLAENKIVNMGREIGYPEELVKAGTLDEEYETLSMNKEHFFEAILDIDKWSTEQNYKKLRESVNESDWRTSGSSVQVVNAFNDLGHNRIEIPLAQLLNPYFDLEVPEYANYGALAASTVGHEILHSFDNQGVQYNWRGDMEDEWSNEAMETFKKRKQCIIDQYSGFKYANTNLSLNGEESQGENIADNGGLKIAYRAYKRLMGEREEPRLPGLEEFNNEQMFMISYASSWCTKYTKEEVQDMVEGDPHSPAEFRVNGVVMNSPEFSRLFHCKRGDPMNPDTKCIPW